MTGRRPARLSWLIAATFQLLVPSLWSVADAFAEAESARGALVHVEATGTAGCPRAHPGDCAVCQLLAHAKVPSRPAAVPFATIHTSHSIVGCPPSLAWLARAPGDPPQRAPPA